VRYVELPRFRADYKALTENEKALFRLAVREMNEAYASRLGRIIPQWPASLRVKSVRGASGVLMTWSFSGPDGRATFEIVQIQGEPAIRWRRIGDHSIFREP
jgi:hypothetical protein